MQSRSSRQGFSLIEVAIALVIFVIGALAIIKIFPGALNVIGNNGDQQIAMNLNRDVAAKLKTDGSVPSATFNTTDDNGLFKWATTGTVNHTADYTDSKTSVIGIPRFNDTLPTQEEINTQNFKSGLSRYRAIQGETAKVFDLTVGAGQEQYVLTQFPISISNNTPLVPVISKNYDLANVRVKPDGTFDFTNVTDADDPTNAPFPAASFKPDSLLYVTYRYKDSSGVIWGIKEEPVVLPPIAPMSSTVDFTTVKVNPPAMGIGAAVNNGIVPEVVKMRLKRYLVTGDFGGASAFEKVGDARRGLVKVPLLNGTDIIPTGTIVSVDYLADWSFIMKDGVPTITPDEIPGTPPTGETYKQIALGTPFVEDKTPVGIYSLLLNRTDNMAYRSSFGEDANTTSTDATKRLIAPSESDLRSGRVTFVTPEATPSRVRVAYQTRDSWTQQLAVAASSYKPYAAGNPEPWRDYYLGSDNYLYFHAGEAGKTVSISYQLNDSAGVQLPPIVDRPFVIDQQIIDTPAGVPAAFASSGKVSRVELSASSGTVFSQDSSGQTLSSIQGVSGNSVTVRTAYINGDRYAQTLLTSNRGTN